MRHVTDDERRARLAVRHALAPAFHAATPEAVTRALTVLHATEPAMRRTLFVFHLGLTADVVRGVNTGRWPTSRPRWTHSSPAMRPLTV